MARPIGVTKHWLKRGDWECWEFVDDNRPEYKWKLSTGKEVTSEAIDSRYAKYDMFSGCVWFTDRKHFTSAEEGNTFYQELLKDGYKPCTEDEVRRIRNYAADMTY